MFAGHEMGERDARNESSRPGSLFFAGLCTGAVVGAGLGLLFAPRTGFLMARQLTDSSAAGAAAATVINATSRTTDDIARAGAPSRVEGLATLGEMAAVHGTDWLAATRG